MSFRLSPNNANYQQRMGFEQTCGVPSDALVYHPKVVSDTTEENRPRIDSATIVPDAHVAPSLPGSPVPGGSVPSEPDYHGNMPPLFQALRSHGPTVELEPGSGAYETVFGASQPDPVPTFTYQAERGDLVPLLGAGGTTVDATLVLAKGAASSLTSTTQYQWMTIFEAGAATHPNPATGETWIRGLPHQWGLRRDLTLNGGTLAPNIYVRIVDSFSDAQGVPWVTMMSRAGSTGPITGTWDVAIGTNVFTASAPGTGAATADLVARNAAKGIRGDTISVNGELLEVDTISDDDSFTTVGNHTAGAAAAFVVGEYGRTNGFVFYFNVEARFDPQLGGPVFAEMRHSTGDPLGERTAGSVQGIFFSDPAGITPLAAARTAALTNPVTVTAGSRVVSVPGGGVLAEVIQGGFFTTVGDTIGKRVTRVISNTSFEVDFAYAALETLVVGTIRNPPTVALTGTVSTTIATTGFTGLGTLFLTELPVGSWVRTVSGQVRRVVAVADDLNATVDAPWAATEGPVAAETDYEFVFVRPQTQWVHVEHVSGPILEQLGEVFVTAQDGTERHVGTAQSLTINHVSGTLVRGGVGREWPNANTAGQSSGTFEIVIAKVDTIDRVIQGSQLPVQFRVEVPGTKLIGDSVFFYSLSFIVNAIPVEPVTNTPDGTTNEVTISGTTHADATAPNGFGDALTVIHIGDDPNPLNL